MGYEEIRIREELSTRLRETFGFSSLYRLWTLGDLAKAFARSPSVQSLYNDENPKVSRKRVLSSSRIRISS